jgi:excinuclease ABC subunit A
MNNSNEKLTRRNSILIKGAREHNLKNIDIEIPRDKLVVITGLSGSGKSSLAFDTIYAEGQRRYVESLSAYARQFLGLMEKPDVDYIEGLSPAISIEQKSTSKNPRSTVGTVTEIYDYLRLLFARIGIPYCYKCGKKIERQTVQQIVDHVMKLPFGTRIQVLAPIVRGRKGEYKDIFENIKRDGYIRVRVDGKVLELDTGEIKLEKNKKHSIDVVVDRLVIDGKVTSRLTDSFESALNLSSGLIVIDLVDKSQLKTIDAQSELNITKSGEILFSEKYACADCGISYEEPTPRMFSFNSPYGACSRCSGLGVKMEIDPDLIVPDKSLSISEGALAPLGENQDGWYFEMIEQLSKYYNFSLITPFGQLTEKAQNVILYGTKEKMRFTYSGSSGGYHEFNHRFEGIVNNLNRRYHQTNSEYIREWIESYMNSIECPECKGARLKKESLSIKISEKNIHQVTEMSIKSAKEFFENLKLTKYEETIAHQVLKEINQRLEFLVNVGLDYLTLNRSAGTLSGGESQRIRLATQIGSQLVGVLYILDEPSIGLHQRDNSRLIDTLKKLRDLGNTVIVVEHDKETMENADFIIDLGPSAGKNGGYVVAIGNPKDIMKNKNSITGLYLAGKKEIPVPKERRKGKGRFITLLGAQGNNLKNLDIKIPLGVFVCVTGVSGSGKSSLINETLYRILSRRFYGSKVPPLKYKDIKGVDNIDKVIDIDQSPIGRTPRSNPATYTGVFTLIRDIFAQLPEAKIRGYKPGRFSFNVKGGRCEACEGDGIKKIEMHFLPDVYVSCEVCKGKRYNRETLEIKYKGKSIADVLDMTVDEAYEFMENIPRVKRHLQTLKDVGLGYIHIGQQATTLSGGEAQRVKLATELSKVGTGNTLYILDEPTTGLHFEDIKMLLNVLNRLVDKGNTVLVIEHNLDVIKTADYIIDLGPEGGDAGGEIIATGRPEEITKVESSHTAKFLRKELKYANLQL